MKIEGQAQRLRIYVNESDRWEGRPLYEAVIRAAKERGIAGATAFRGIEGYGTSGRVHSVKVLHLSEDVPIIVEMVDEIERIADLLPVLDTMISEGVLTIDAVERVVYRREAAAPAAVEFDDEIQLDVEEPELPTESRTAEVKLSGLEMTDQAHQLLAEARQRAGESRRPYVDSVDILLAMLCESRGLAERVLRQQGLDCRAVKRHLQETVSRDEVSPSYLTSFKAKCDEAAKWLEDEYVGTEHLLLALCLVRPSAATDTLMRLGAQPRDIIQEVLTVVGHDDDWQRWLADHPEL